MATTYLSKTPSSAGNRKTFTFSTWIKRSKLSSTQTIFMGGQSDGNNNITVCQFQSADTLRFYSYSSAFSFQLITDRLFRDTSAWMHILVAVDTTQATDSNRIKIYINGVQETSFSTETYPSQNFDTYINNNNLHTIGNYNAGTEYFDGSMTHFHFIDGTQYAASDFGESDSTSGIWKPKTAPSVTYGTNGFFLKFENSGAMGTDSSGNSNTFTVSGTLTQNVDTPSNNFATMSPLHKGSNVALTNGNLTCTGSGSNASVASTLAVSTGKWYWEAKLNSSTNNYFNVGILKSDVRIDNLAFPGDVADGYVYAVDGNIYRSGSSLLSTGTTLSVGNIVGFLLDLDNGTLKLKVNGSDVYSGNAVVSSLNTGDFWYVAQGANPSSVDINFGNGYFGTTSVASAGTAPSEGGIFEYDCPSGYQALCTKGINSF
jgi:hypothetical protein